MVKLYFYPPADSFYLVYPDQSYEMLDDDGNWRAGFGKHMPWPNDKLVMEWDDCIYVNIFGVPLAEQVS